MSIYKKSTTNTQTNGNVSKNNQRADKNHIKEYVQSTFSIENTKPISFASKSLFDKQNKEDSSLLKNEKYNLNTCTAKMNTSQQSIFKIKNEDENKDILNTQANDNENNTNICITNLYPNFTEEDLYKIFLKFGDIQYVKIVLDNENNNNFAIINFIKNESAKNAIEQQRHQYIKKRRFRISWGKKSSFQSDTIVNPMAYNLLPHIYINIPQNKFTKKLIDKISKIVSEEGHVVEKYLIEKESGNPDFNFLMYLGTEENNYYRWRVFSYAQGDCDNFWRETPFQFNIGGNIWHPPINTHHKISHNPVLKKNQDKEESKMSKKYNLKLNIDDTLKVNLKRKGKSPLDENLQVTDNDEDEEEDSNKPIHVGMLKLNEDKFKQFQKILLSLNSKRNSIKTATIFCFDNIECCKQIIDILYESFMNVKKHQDKINKLYLLSDLLFNSLNSNIFNSWLFKKELENILPDVFEELNKILNDIKGKKLAENYRDRIISILAIWKEWKAFELPYLEGLRVSFLKRRKTISEEFSKILKSKIEIYEDELLELYSQDESNLISLANYHGISTRGEVEVIISKLISLKEHYLLEEMEKNEKIQQEKEIEKKYLDHLAELDKRINQLQNILHSFQDSYKSINDFDVDGIIIDPIEYELLNISISNTDIKTELGTNEVEFENDLDGEPI